jgi:hypothetical protein
MGGGGPTGTGRAGLAGAPSSGPASAATDADASHAPEAHTVANDAAGNGDAASAVPGFGAAPLSLTGPMDGGATKWSGGGAELQPHTPSVAPSATHGIAVRALGM